MKVLHSIAVAVVALVAGAANAQRAPNATIDILAYNDVYELLPDTVNGLTVGGPSRVVPVVRDMRAKNPNSLVLFAGDTMSPSLWSSQFKGMQMADAHKAIGLDFASLGNHEFDFGVEGFLNVSNAVNFPWLNANCYELATGALLRGTRPRAIKTLSHPSFGTIRVGVFGVMYDMKDSSKGLFWTDPIEAAKRQVDALKAANADLIIALTHQDLADDNRLSNEVPGLNIIYGGHDHSSMLQTNFGTPYLKADFNFRSVWMSRVEYFASVGSTAATYRMRHTAVPITEDMPTDAGLETVIQGYSNAIGELFKGEVGSICEPGLNLRNVVVRVKDAPIGHIFADAQLKFYGEGAADVSISNGGGIRTDKVYPAGPITLGEIVAWSPFGNTVMITETDGRSLKDFIVDQVLAASCGAGNLIQPNGFYPHPAGVKWEFQCTGEKTGTLTKLEWLNHPTRTGPVLDTDVFKLALNNFLYNTEFTTLATPPRTLVLKSELEAVRIDAALEWYIKQQKDAVICQQEEGRSLVSFEASG